MEECGPCPIFASFTPAFALQLKKEARENLSQGSLRVTVYLPKHPHITKITHTYTHTLQNLHTHYKTYTHTHTHTRARAPTHYKTHTLQNNIKPPQYKLKQTQNKVHPNEIVTI